MTANISSTYVNPFPNKPCSTSLENTVGKGEIAQNEQFLLFQQCFLPLLPFLSNLKFLSAHSFSLEESQVCHLGKS